MLYEWRQRNVVNAQPTRLTSALFTMALCLVLACALLPVRAHATYKDVSSELPASQELGDLGNVISGDEIPNGTYTIKAKTSSRMCIMYASKADAENKENKERCLLHVSNGNMVVEFYMSSAYSRLYLGTAEEAASLTNEDGTDDSAYLAGDPADGYVPHLYSFSIPSLNQTLLLAAYSGGDPSNTRAKWYDRNAVFIPTDEVTDAMNGKSDEPEKTEDEGKKDPEKKDEGKKGSGKKNTGTKDKGNNDTSDDDDDDFALPNIPDDDDTNGKAAGGKKAGSSNGTGSGNANNASQGTGSSANSSKKAEKKESGDKNGSERKNAPAVGDLGKAAFGMTYVGPEADQGSSAGEELPQARALEEDPLLTPERVAGLGALSLFAGGMLARVLLFRRGLKFPPKKHSADLTA